MRIDLNLPAGPGQRAFRAYLNAELGNISRTHTSTGAFDADGNQITTIEGTFLLEGEEVSLHWTFFTQSKGALQYVEVESKTSGFESVRWEDLASKFVLRVMTSALAQTKTKFFKRRYFYYFGAELDGEYWVSGVRFAPYHRSDEASNYLISDERVVSIDMTVEAIDDWEANAIADAEGRIHAARLSLLLNVGLRRIESEKRWVLPNAVEEAQGNPVRRQLGFWHVDREFSTMPEKGKYSEPGKYAGSLGDVYPFAGRLLSLPPEARRILRAMSDAEPLVGDAFDRGARLFQVAKIVGREFPSVGLAYQVAAVEAIGKYMKPAKSFSDFIRHYAREERDIEAYLNFTYGTVRSANFHAGEFPLGEFEARNNYQPLFDAERLKQADLEHGSYVLIRRAIVNWMLDVLLARDGGKALLAENVEK